MARTRRVSRHTWERVLFGRRRLAAAGALARSPSLSCSHHSPTHPLAHSSPPSQRKKRTHIPDGEDPSKKGQPRSFVLRRGRHGALLRDLEMDLRKVGGC